ncbi:hypothetical protein GALL_542570 [mine drainage metagenome]|uniref:Uncharacterized protein n=1 Tax=mine drainage metagenome TaxID=410659 RepID=A0A1J5P0V7_9ZZZZ
MASAVLAKRYNAAPGRPSSTNQKIGATTESFRFSARVSMALSRTWVAVSWLTSRLTSQRRRSRPASSDWPSAASTASTSVFSMVQASKGLSANPSNTPVAHQGRLPSAVCKHQATPTTIAAQAYQASVASQKAL